VRSYIIRTVLKTETYSLPNLCLCHPSWCWRLFGYRPEVTAVFLHRKKCTPSQKLGAIAQKNVHSNMREKW